MTLQRWRPGLAWAFLSLAVMARAQSAPGWTSYKMADGLSEPVFNSVFFTPQGKLIGATTNAPRAAELDGYFVSNFPAPPGGPGRIAASPGGQRWALSTQGLLEFKRPAWRLHPIPEITAALRAEPAWPGAIPAFLPIRQGCVLFVLPQGLMEFSEEVLGAPRTFTLRAAAQSGIGPFTGLAVTGDGALWISGADGLARVPGPFRNVGTNSEWREYFRPDGMPPGALSQPMPDENNGIILLAEDAANHRQTVVTFDGRVWGMASAGARHFIRAWRGPEHGLWAATSDTLCQWVPDQTNWVENDDISPGQIYDVAGEGNGVFWLATADGLFRYAGPLWRKSAMAREPARPASVSPANRTGAPDQPPPPVPPIGPSKSVVGFANRPDGNILCATLDQLWEYDGHNWSLLKYRFNHINALLAARDGRIWLASNGGLFRDCSGIWLDNGPAEGLPGGAVSTLGETSGGQLWAATTRGIYEFHPEADADPPRTFARQLTGADQQLKEGEPLSLSFGGEDKWKYTPADRLLFSYQIDQLGWTAFEPGTLVSLPGQMAGRHYFQVRAMDRNGRIDPSPATLVVTILTPWFREARLWVVLVLGAGAALFFAAVAWHRHVLLMRSHAAIERKVAERTRELEIATRELLHSQKMNALGTLAAGIAHDFNNILSIIKGSAQIIEDNPGQAEKIRTRTARIKTVVQQGAEIVEAMLGFSRGAGTPLACDINTVVAETLKLLGDRFLRETEIEFVRGEHLPELTAAREFIQQILINFIFNAAEAMEGRKKITLATTNADRAPATVVLSPAAATAYVLISVADQGAGMTPEIQARIFEPFFTTKAMSARRGTGLGLSMVYELAKKMGAGLAVESTAGRGSEFTLILPVLTAPKMETPKDRPAAAPPP